LRFLLAYTKTEHEARVYEAVSEGNSYNHDCWFKVKHNLGFDFPNVSTMLLFFSKTLL